MRKIGGFANLIKVNDIGVPENFKNVDFSVDSFYFLEFLKLLFLDYFDSNLLVSLPVDGDSNFAEITLSDCFSC